MRKFSPELPTHSVTLDTKTSIVIFEIDPTNYKRFPEFKNSDFKDFSLENGIHKNFNGKYEKKFFIQKTYGESFNADTLYLTVVKYGEGKEIRGLYIYSQNTHNYTKKHDVTENTQIIDPENYIVEWIDLDDIKLFLNSYDKILQNRLKIHTWTGIRYSKDYLKKELGLLNKNKSKYNKLAKDFNLPTNVLIVDKNAQDKIENQVTKPIKSLFTLDELITELIDSDKLLGDNVLNNEQNNFTSLNSLFCSLYNSFQHKYNHIINEDNELLHFHKLYEAFLQNISLLITNRNVDFNKLVLRSYIEAAKEERQKIQFLKDEIEQREKVLQSYVDKANDFYSLVLKDEELK